MRRRNEWAFVFAPVKKGSKTRARVEMTLSLVKKMERYLPKKEGAIYRFKAPVDICFLNKENKFFKLPIKKTFLQVDSEERVTMSIKLKNRKEELSFSLDYLFHLYLEVCR